MRALLVTIAVAGSSLCAAAPYVVAQTSGSGTEIDGLIAYGVVRFETPEQLYESLTAAGRCPPRELAKPREPCAFVLYERVSGEGRPLNLKPVFEVVSERRVLVMHDRKLQYVAGHELYFDIVRALDQSAGYRSYAVIGNVENRTNCESGRPCLNDVLDEDIFLMYGHIPDAVVEAIWGPQKMKDPGTVRVR